MVHREFDETGQNALATAKMVAALPEIVQAFKEPNPSLQIQPIAKNLRKKNRSPVYCRFKYELNSLQPS